MFSLWSRSISIYDITSHLYITYLNGDKNDWEHLTGSRPFSRSFLYYFTWSRSAGVWMDFHQWIIEWNGSPYSATSEYNAIYSRNSYGVAVLLTPTVEEFMDWWY